MNTRALASQLVYEVLHNGRSLSQVLPIFKSKCKNSQDGALVQAMAFGVIRWFPRLHFIIHQLLQKPLKSKDSEVLYLIAVGLYQLMDMQIAEHAAVSETVAATKEINKIWAKGLVNAVLRSYQRQAHSLQSSIQNNPEALYAHPQWLIDEIKTCWPNEWKSILEANNQLPPLYLRINLQKTTREAYLDQLLSREIEAESIPFNKAGVLLKSPLDITTLPGFKEGLFSVQDIAAQFAVDLLDLSPSLSSLSSFTSSASPLRILDACAAPGGKTAHILETEPSSELIALDISPTRTKLISENLQRLQLTAQVITNDAKNPAAWWDQQLFDRILLDAPCSATGVIRRHPDIKILRKPNDIHQVTEQQDELLKALWPLLRPGGILVYATCSILAEENSKRVEKFLSYQTDAQILSFALPIGIKQSIGYQLLPGQNNTDGFYYARIKKSE
jgi:16S rRNA (cytosine967-C5)-methyltransferase